MWHSLKFQDNSPIWKSFRTLGLEKNSLFDFKPWKECSMSQHLPFIGMFRWAVDHAHIPLLNLLLKPTKGSELRSYYMFRKNRGTSTLLKAIHVRQDAMIDLWATLCTEESLRPDWLVNITDGCDLHAAERLLDYFFNCGNRLNDGKMEGWVKEN